MLHCGLLGEKLGHSYSPMIHAQLAGYTYALYEKSAQELSSFLENGEWDGLNVTIPYKKAVLSYCSELSPQARQLGSVNTLLRLKNGKIYGDNTDYFGFLGLVENSTISVTGRRAIVLGSGGASATVCAALRALGAESVCVISRSGEDNYHNLERHRDAQIIVNTTPLGMFPNNGAAAVDLRDFPSCEGVFDLIYNPYRTALLMQAEQLGIPCIGGLHMLVAQAARSSELFTGTAVSPKRVIQIENAMHSQLQNIVLIGMPGCGKSTAAKELGRRLGRRVFESDAIIEQRSGMTIPEIFVRFGEEYFRKIESEVLAELGKLSGIVISTGGGCVSSEGNYPVLHQNGQIFYIRRSLEDLSVTGRPLSQKYSLQELFEQRKVLYERFADHIIDNNADISFAAAQIEEKMK